MTALAEYAGCGFASSRGSDRWNVTCKQQVSTSNLEDIYFEFFTRQVDIAVLNSNMLPAVLTKFTSDFTKSK
jgi:hypothetical protein